MIKLRSKRFSVGMKMHRLTVIDIFRGPRNAIWCKCRCDCGTIKDIYGHALFHGTKSCGCLNKEIVGNLFRTHGMKHSPEYRAWHDMKNRCENHRNHNYGNYGGRGISVCERWNLFVNFYEDMGARPGGMSLDRISNDAGYSPQNCRWASAKEQANNRRGNRPIELDGKKITLSEAASASGLNRTTIRKRLNSGWAAERAITQAPRRARGVN